MQQLLSPTKRNTAERLDTYGERNYTMINPILWTKHKVRYHTRKIRWYLRRDVLAHRWYLGAWPITTYVSNGIVYEYGYPIGIDGQIHD
jgi:hypothetical protein